jgi:PBP1b-binding outer membrane lipoprotein LpoB
MIKATNQLRSLLVITACLFIAGCGTSYSDKQQDYEKPAEQRKRKLNTGEPVPKSPKYKNLDTIRSHQPKYNPQHGIN